MGARGTGVCEQPVPGEDPADRAGMEQRGLDEEPAGGRDQDQALHGLRAEEVPGAGDREEVQGDDLGRSAVLVRKRGE